MAKLVITKPKLLLGEGKDEVAFFETFLAYLKIENIQVIEYGGKNKINAGLTGIVDMPGFDKVIAIGITRDADHFGNPAGAFTTEERNIGESQAAFDSICSALRNTNLGLPVPLRPLEKATLVGKPAVSIYILSDCASAGMLEDLCLQTLTNSPEMQCVDGYFTCIQEQRVHPIHKQAKARLRTWIASQEEPDLLLGQAAAKGYWNFEHPAFAKLKQFMQTL